MEREFKVISDFPSYLISNDGIVRNIKTGKLLKYGVDKDGYFRVCLFKDGKGINKLVHRLVAQTFIPNPEDCPIVDHIDRNRLNNNIDNLRWVTHKGNSRNTINNKAVKLIHEDGSEMQFATIIEAAEFLDVSINTLIGALQVSLLNYKAIYV